MKVPTFTPKAPLQQPDTHDLVISKGTILSSLGSTPVGFWDVLHSTDFRNEFTPIRRQMSGNCAVHGLLACFEHEWYRLSGKAEKPVLSAAFAYWCARQIAYPVGDGVEWRQLGVTQRNVLKALHIYGVCEESMFAETIQSYEKPPPADRFIQALQYRAKYSSAVDPAILKWLLARQVSVACIVPWHVGFDAAEMWSSDSGITPAPVIQLPEETTAGTCISYHAVCLAGYDDSRQCWLLRNSAGDPWGDRGYAWLPYSYTLRDLWTVTGVGST